MSQHDTKLSWLYMLIIDKNNFKIVNGFFTQHSAKILCWMRWAMRTLQLYFIDTFLLFLHIFDTI